MTLPAILLSDRTVVKGTIKVGFVTKIAGESIDPPGPAVATIYRWTVDFPDNLSAHHRVRLVSKLKAEIATKLKPAFGSFMRRPFDPWFRYDGPLDSMWQTLKRDGPKTLQPFQEELLHRVLPGWRVAEKGEVGLDKYQALFTATWTYSY